MTTVCLKQNTTPCKEAHFVWLGNKHIWFRIYFRVKQMAHGSWGLRSTVNSSDRVPNSIDERRLEVSSNPPQDCITWSCLPRACPTPPSKVYLWDGQEVGKITCKSFAKNWDDRIKASAIPLHSTYATVYSNQISPVELGELSLRVSEMEKDMEVRQGREASTLVF